MAHKSEEVKVLIYTLIKVCIIHILKFKCLTNIKVNGMQKLFPSYIFNFHILVHSVKCAHKAIRKLNPTVYKERYSDVS